ncbi:hypothetical protein APHACPA_1681 [Rickettsia amblyommatis str. Ac/Pa]|uniref:Uncharacterized protein n=2 Tax=Rickettsia amblyommatis TaxID=33989 RepID=A0A0F3N3Q1_RICAM|nr:hypothetical protein [Rickettsia amblyommatis]ALA62054.1 hypothetical protein AL573_05655 [Rickettsia amblyommatis]KJV62650.1 hypothetical protein APHACPA_1681 [Rickettsia amblyommatis str. Ac/Pa]
MYKKKQDKESIDSYKQLGARVQAVRAKSSIEKMEDPFLVKEKILSAEEIKAIISNHELLNTLASYNDMASANAVTKLFEIARNYYEDDKHKGMNELEAINDIKTTYLLNENI